MKIDVVGYNYLDSRYEEDRLKFPDRVICGTESYPKMMAAVWKKVEENPHVIGDFTWDCDRLSWGIWNWARFVSHTS